MTGKLLPKLTYLDNMLVFTFAPTLQFEGVTMRQAHFSTAGTLTGRGTFIVGMVWREDEVMVVNLKVT